MKLANASHAILKCIGLQSDATQRADLTKCKDILRLKIGFGLDSLCRKCDKSKWNFQEVYKMIGSSSGFTNFFQEITDKEYLLSKIRRNKWLFFRRSAHCALSDLLKKMQPYVGSTVSLLYTVGLVLPSNSTIFHSLIICQLRMRLVLDNFFPFPSDDL